MIDDDLCKAFDMQQARTPNNQLSLFSRQVVRNEDTQNGFEIWRRPHKQFSLQEKAKATNFLKEIVGFRVRNDHLESDPSEFMMLKNRQT